MASDSNQAKELLLWIVRPDTILSWSGENISKLKEYSAYKLLKGKVTLRMLVLEEEGKDSCVEESGFEDCLRKNGMGDIVVKQVGQDNKENESIRKYVLDYSAFNDASEYDTIIVHYDYFNDKTDEKDRQIREQSLYDIVRLVHVNVERLEVVRKGEKIEVARKKQKKVTRKSGDEKAQHKLFGGEIVGRIDDVNTEAMCVSKAPIRVYLRGETGTGKSRLARYIHENSGRSFKSLGTTGHGKLIKELLEGRNTLSKEDTNSRAGVPGLIELNIAGLPQQTVESELFGHVKGAFTDAKNASPGAFIAAHGGTLFLDEIAECPLPVQAKLLTVIQPRNTEKEKGVEYPCYVTPTGQNLEEILVDVRLIVATNKDLLEEVEKGNFRRDLYYRLVEYTIELPSWRQIKGSIKSHLSPDAAKDNSGKIPHDDLDDFIEHILEDVNNRYLRRRSANFLYIRKELSQDARELLRDYDFPGNYRQVENALIHACLQAHVRCETYDKTGNKKFIERIDLPGEISKPRVLEGFEGEEWKYLRELAEIGVCTMDDLRILSRMENFSVTGVDDYKNKIDRQDLRELAFIIRAIKDSDSKMTKADCAREVVAPNASDRTPLRVVGKFGIKFEDLRTAIWPKHF